MDLHKKRLFWRSFLGYFLLPRPTKPGLYKSVFYSYSWRVGWGRYMLPSAVSTVHRLLHLALSLPAHTLKKKLHFAEDFLSLLAKENHIELKDMSSMFFAFFRYSLFLNSLQSSYLSLLAKDKSQSGKRHVFFLIPIFQMWLVSEHFAEHYHSLLAKENHKVYKDTSSFPPYFRSSWFLNSLQSIIFVWLAEVDKDMFSFFFLFFQMWLVSEQFSEHYLCLLAKKIRETSRTCLLFSSHFLYVACF